MRTQLTDAGAAMDDAANSSARPEQRRRARAARWQLIALFALFVIPVAASYYTYYVLRPAGRTNYGMLVEPMRQLGSLGHGEAAPGGLSSLHGRWVMLVVGPAACDEACRERLYNIRQVRLTTGKDRVRVERAWLVTDAADPDPELLARHEGLLVLHADAAEVARLVPAEAGSAVSDHIYMIDPLENLMMRFPKDADPSRMKKDLAKLLRASGIG